MELIELLQFVVGVIEGMGLRYFVTGSMATIYYGEPRLTNDIDVVVELSEERVMEFCRGFPQKDYYASEAAALAAVVNKGQFNVIHPESGLKVDVIVPEGSLFNASRFERARRAPVTEGFEAIFASPEDVVLKKMEYYEMGKSEKHLRDITGVLKASRDEIDAGYVGEWAERMGVGDLWRAIQERVQD